MIFIMKNTTARKLAASVLAAVMAASAVPAAVSNAVSAAPALDIVQTKGASLATMGEDDAYSGAITDYVKSGAKSITFTLLSSTYDTSFSYGFGCSTQESPYWLELDKSGKWVDGSKAEGSACKLDKASSTITIDLSKAGAKPGGKFEFRCYYSAHWDNSKGDMVDNTVKLTGVEFDGGSSSSSSGSSSGVESKNKKSGSWSFKDNKDGTATISATVTKQLDELDYDLTVGYDEDYYAEKGVTPDESDPINSHKFKYEDFGVPSSDDITIESLYVVVEADYDVDKFMYGCGTNVAMGSPSDTEYAKRGIIDGKDDAGYWYNDMGEEMIFALWFDHDVFSESIVDHSHKTVVALQRDVLIPSAKHAESL